MDADQVKPKNAHAVALGRRRQAQLTPAQRSLLGRHAVMVRWRRWRQAQVRQAGAPERIA